MSNGTSINIGNFTWEELLINSSIAFNNRRLSLELNDPKRELYETLSKLTHYAFKIEKHERKTRKTRSEKETTMEQ